MPFSGPERTPPFPGRGPDQQVGGGAFPGPEPTWQPSYPDRSSESPTSPAPVRPPMHPGRPAGQPPVPGTGRPDGLPSAFAGRPADPSAPPRPGDTRQYRPTDNPPAGPSWPAGEARSTGPARPADPYRQGYPGESGRGRPRDATSAGGADEPSQYGGRPGQPPLNSRPVDAARPGYPEQHPERPAPARSRRRLLILAACLLVLALVGGGIVVARPAALFGSSASGAPSAVGTSSEPAPPPVLSAAGSHAPEPSADAVQAALAGLVVDPKLGTHVGVEVIDVASGHQLYGDAATDAVIPASTNKLTTAAAVLAARGAAYRIPTRVVAGASPGEVVIIGGGDPTLAAGDTPYYPGAAKLSDLAAQVKAALGGATPTKVTVDSSLFVGSSMGPGWLQADLDTGQSARITALMTDGGRSNPSKSNARSPKPDVAAGTAFAKLLGVPASAVVLGSAPEGSEQASPAPQAATGSAGTSPQSASSGAVSTHAPGQLLGVVYSPPLVRIVETMLSTSDNTVAEVMARQVALATGAEASFPGAADAVLKKLADLGIDTGGATLVDGSGLSNQDRLTPRLLTGLLATAAGGKHPELAGVLSGLPVAGYSGTLSLRYRSPGSGADAGIGEVRAKTGTLTGVSSLAGVVVDASGRLLAFAVVADQVPVGGTTAAEGALDRVAAALAALQ